MDDVPSSPSARAENEVLIAKGWRQGAVFATPVHGLKMAVNATVGEITLDVIKPGTLLVVVTHDCDIAHFAEHHVEVLECQFLDTSNPDDRNKLRNYSKYNPRRFVLNTDTGLIVLAERRLLLSKDILRELDAPDNLVSDSASLGRFCVWLARRFDRHAWEGPADKYVINPLINRVNKLAKSSTDEAYQVRQSIFEIRVDVDESEAPMPVNAFLIVDDIVGDVRSEDLDFIAKLEEELVDCLDIRYAYMQNIHISLRSEFLMIEWERTVQLSLEWLSDPRN